MLLLTALLIGVMALAHLFSNKLLFLQGIPRSPWLSMAGGSRSHTSSCTSCPN
jgi:hypothetical protein